MEIESNINSKDCLEESEADLENQGAGFGSDPGHGPGEILVVDDNQEVLEAVTGLLKKTGFEVQCAKSAVEALCMLENSRPDLILSDIQMDGLDGFEFQKIVRQSGELFQVPFVFLSALSEPSEVRAGKSSGCDDYLVKPFQPEDLMAVIQGKIFSSRKRKSFSQQAIKEYCRGIIERLSHEIRTPLVAVNTGAELLQMKLKGHGDSSLEDLGMSIQRGGSRLQKLVEDFMTLQSIESGKARELFNANKSEVGVVDLLTKSVSHLQDFSLDERAKINLQLDSSIEREDPRICIFELQITDILKRVLENSIKFAGHEKEVDISVGATDDNVSILVRDFGPGLKDTDFRLAQSLFGQIGRASLEQQGCGLGIAIATYFTEINEGDLSFHNPKEGPGLVVEARFPRSKS